MDLRHAALPAILGLTLAACGSAASPAASTDAGPCPDPTASTLGHTPPLRGLAFVRREGQYGPTHLFAMNADGSGIHKLTSDTKDDAAPVWSPDGTRVAFVRTQSGQQPQPGQIFVMNSDGTGVSRLTCLGSRDDRPAWSPDGSRIAFARSTGKTTAIYVMQADGSNLHLLFQPVTAYALSLAWSPDGKRFAFGDPTGIAVVNADGTGFRQLTGPSTIQTPDDLPAWSPDSKSIAFDHSVLTSKELGADVQLWVMTADGRNQHTLIAESRHDLANPSWSPDGRQVAFFRWGDSTQGLTSIEVASSSGTGVHLLTQPTRDFMVGPAWSPVR